MPRNRVQHQKGLSDDAFERLYPDEEACRKAWFAWRWPEGFKCPRCAAAEYCEIRDRQLLQCRRCRYQSSLIAGTVLQGTKLPMRVWFRAMHLLAQGKKGLSNIELGRRLGVSTNAAWRVQHMPAMIERDRWYQLGAAGPRIEIDDAYIGGERTGQGAGRGRRGHTPFIIAVETSADGRPLRVANDPADAAVYSGYGGRGSVDDLAAMYRTHTHHNHPIGATLKKQLVLYTDELKGVNVIKKSTNFAKFADRIYIDVLS